MLIALVLVLCCGCFIKVATALGILKIGLGLADLTTSVVVVVLAFVLSLWSLETPLRALGGSPALLDGKILSWELVEKAFKPHLTQQADPELLKKLQSAQTPGAQPTEPSFVTALVAASVAQLKAAFDVGILIIIPFLVLDLLITNVLMLLGVTQMPTAVISVPAKLLLFVAVGGWELLVQKLLGIAI